MWQNSSNGKRQLASSLKTPTPKEGSHSEGLPGREDLRLYLVNSEVSQASSSIREDVQSINTRGGATTDEAMTLIEDGADFSSTALPTIQEVLGGTPPEVPQGQPDAKGKGKGKRTRKTKGKQTEGQVNENENTKPEGEQQGDKVPTPLEKAMALKKAVCLSYVSLYSIFCVDPFLPLQPGNVR